MTAKYYVWWNNNGKRMSSRDWRRMAGALPLRRWCAFGLQMETNWRAHPEHWSEIGPWHSLHKWSPWRLLGFDLWRWERDDPHGIYCYVAHGRSKKVAREELHSLYAPTRQQADDICSN